MLTITVYDAEYDNDVYEDAKDAMVIELGILVVIDGDDKAVAMYAPGAWRQVEFDRGE